MNTVEIKLDVLNVVVVAYAYTRKEKHIVSRVEVLKYANTKNKKHHVKNVEVPGYANIIKWLIIVQNVEDLRYVFIKNPNRNVLLVVNGEFTVTNAKNGFLINLD